MTADSRSPLGRLARWFPEREHHLLFGALRGVDPVDCRSAGDLLLAGSAEAELLLTAVPGLLAMARLATIRHPERCVGELRGAVLWGETLSARASALGQEDVFICATYHRSPDLPENRVLVSALASIATAGSLLHTPLVALVPPEERPRLEDLAIRAREYLRSPRLAGVPRGPVRTRDLPHLRHGRRHRSHAPLRRFVVRSQDPFGIDALGWWCDRRTRLEHAAIDSLAGRLIASGVRLDAPRIEGGRFVWGPISYRHPEPVSPTAVPGGLRLGELGLEMVEGPDWVDDAERRAAGRAEPKIMLVRSTADLDEAVAALTGD